MGIIDLFEGLAADKPVVTAKKDDPNLPAVQTKPNTLDEHLIKVGNAKAVVGSPALQA